VGQSLSNGKVTTTRLGNFICEEWNRGVSVADIVSGFEATWICFLGKNAVPHYL
jgi:hypothetical protein